MNKFSSPQRVLANQQNGRKGRGAVSEEGKARSSKNALRHGILARQVVLQSDSDEEKREFATLFSAMKDYYQPIGIQEELLVEEISVCYWRKRRVLRTEAAEISQAQPAGARGQFAGAVDTDNENGWFPEWDERRLISEMLILHAPRLKTGLEEKLTCLMECIQEAQERGYLSEESLVRLRNADSDTGFHLMHNTVECCRAYSILAHASTDENSQGMGLPNLQACKERILDALRRRHLLEIALARLKELRRPADRQSEVLAPTSDTDRLLRYEAAIDRQLYRAIAMLDHLQSRRKGRAAPQLIS